MNDIERLSNIRTKLAPLLAEKLELDQYPKTREEMLAGIKADFANAEQTARDHLAQRLKARARGREMDHLIALNEDASYRAPEHGEFAAMLIAAAGSKAIEAMCLEAIADLPLQPTKKVRDSRLAELQKQLDALERDEERIIDAAEQQDIWLPRRADARAEIVLAIV